MQFYLTPENYQLTISTVYTIATGVANNQHAARYDIADGGRGQDDWGADDGEGAWGGWWTTPQGNSYGGRWRTGGGHQDGASDQWHYGYCNHRWSDDDAQEMDTDDVQVPLWMRDEPVEEMATDPRAWKRAHLAGDHPNGFQGRHTDVAEASQDRERAVQMQAQLADAAAALQRQGYGPADQTALVQPTEDSGATARLERRREELWHAAQDEGVEITHDAFMALGAHELEEWAEAHIQGI